MLDEVEALLASPVLVVDAGRYVVRDAAARSGWRPAGAVRARARLRRSLARAT